MLKDISYKKTGIQLFIACAILLVAGLLTGSRIGILSNIIFVLFWCLILVGSYFFYKCKTDISLKTGVQFFTVSLFMCAFWFSTLRETMAFHTRFDMAIVISGSLSLVISTLLWCLSVSQYSSTVKDNIKHFFKSNYNIIIICVIFSVLCLDCFTILFKSDSNIYYTSITSSEGKWNFTLGGLRNFQLGYHSSYGYSLFLYIGNYLLRYLGIGVRIVNLFLIIITAFVLNDIIKKLFPQKSRIFNSLIVCCFMFNPLILGLFQELSLDFGIVCFLIWFIWAFMNEYKFFSVFFGCLICFTKEYAILLIFGYMAGIYFLRLFKNKRQTNKLLIFPSLKLYEWAILYVPILFVADFFTNNSWGKVEDSAPALGTVDFLNSPQFNPHYILIKLKQIFLMNFQWIIILFVIGAVILWLLRRKQVKLNETLVGIFASSILFFLFNMFYFTYPHYRYLAPNAFYFVILIGFTINLLSNKKVQITALSLVSVLFLVQSFYSIDPISNNIFYQVSTGNGTIISHAYYSGYPLKKNFLLSKKDGGDLSNEVFRDYVQNNRQYIGFEKCFEKLMTEIDYSDDKALVISPIYVDSAWRADKWTFVNLFGTLNQDDIHWNPKLKQITNEYPDMSINWLNIYKDVLTFDDYDEVWYIEFPYTSNFDFEGYLNNFNVLEKKTVTQGQWKINAYRVTLANKNRLY